MKFKSWDWERVKGEEREYWLYPAKEVFAFVFELKQKGFSKVYDLGCGIGRNLFYLIDQGFDVKGSDLSEPAVNEVNSKLEAIEYPNRVKCGLMTEICEPDSSFDAAIAFHVVNHGYEADCYKAVQEINRILKPGGLALITFLSRRSVQGAFENPQVEEWTIIRQDGVEAGIPHHFFDREEILKCMHGFDILELSHVEREYDQLSRMSCHYYAKGVKKAED